MTIAPGFTIVLNSRSKFQGFSRCSITSTQSTTSNSGREEPNLLFKSIVEVMTWLMGLVCSRSLIWKLQFGYRS